MRYFFHISYRGSGFSGWQKHPKVKSIQQEIELALSSIFKQNVSVVGCGRTDSGVHASQFFFHADFDRAWDFDLKFRLNKILSSSIAVHDIIPMEGLPHARFDAYERHYDYFFHTFKSPFLAESSACYEMELPALQEMALAASILPNFDDFRAFCKSPDSNMHTICHLSRSVLYSNLEKNRFRLHIRSNRFLGGMIRIIAGKLLEIGSGQLQVEQFEHYLAIRQRPEIIRPAYAEGLFLSKVRYPYMDLPAAHDLSALYRADGKPYWEPVNALLDL